MGAWSPPSTGKPLQAPSLHFTNCSVFNTLTREHDLTLRHQVSPDTQERNGGLSYKHFCFNQPCRTVTQEEVARMQPEAQESSAQGALRTAAAQGGRNPTARRATCWVLVHPDEQKQGPWAARGQRWWPEGRVLPLQGRLARLAPCLLPSPVAGAAGCLLPKSSLLSP